MSDNIEVTPGVGATVATDEVLGQHFQRVKITTGVDGTATDVSSSNPVPVSGTVTVTDVATATLQGTGNTTLTSIATKLDTSLTYGATAANQTTANGSLATIASNTTLVDSKKPTIAYQATGRVHNGTSELTVKYAFANVSASQTDSSIVAAVSGKKIRVLSAFIVAGGTATDVTFNTKGGGAGTAISAKLANAANGGAVLPPSALGWFETTSGEALTVTTGAGSATGIQVTYVEA